MMSLGTSLKARRLICAGLSGALTFAAALMPALAEEPKRGGTLTVGLAQDPPIVDPIRTGSFTERQFATGIYESLFDIDEKGQAVPFLAESFTVSDDVKNYRVKLRPNVKFHDGTALDAEAVVANLDRTRNPANGCRCLSFLQDIADGHYDGKPAMLDELQTLENPALRAFLKVDKSVEGIVVHRPDQTSGSPLKEWDVISKIAGTPIDDQGMIKLGSDKRVSFQYLIQKVAKNNKVDLTIVRDNKPMDVQLPVSNDRHNLMTDLRGTYPSYFVYGPMVFSRATVQFLSFMRNNPNILTSLGYIGSPLVTRLGDTPSAEREELVVVSSPFFPHKLAAGYSSQSAGVVYSVNGTPIRSLKHLVSVLRDLQDDFVVFEFDHRDGEALVFPRKDTVAATEDILTDNGVRAQGSADLLEVWNAKGGTAAAGK